MYALYVVWAGLHFHLCLTCRRWVWTRSWSLMCCELSVERERGREGGREKEVCVCAFGVCCLVFVYLCVTTSVFKLMSCLSLHSICFLWFILGINCLCSDWKQSIVCLQRAWNLPHLELWSIKVFVTSYPICSESLHLVVSCVVVGVCACACVCILGVLWFLVFTYVVVYVVVPVCVCVRVCKQLPSNQTIDRQISAHEKGSRAGGWS